MLTFKLKKWLMLGLLSVCLSAQAQAEAPKGSLVMIGGALRFNNMEVWQRIVQLAGGPGSRIAVFASAAGNPKSSADLAIDALKKAGGEPFFVPVAVRLADIDFRKAAADPEWVQKVGAATGVYFTGGDQGRITQVLRDAAGADTPVLQAVWEVYRRGGVIAGSSAGAAIMSTAMFQDAIPVLNTLKAGVSKDTIMGAGLGFIGPDVFVDQHLFTRGRFARMLPAMLTHGYKMGIGIDENTAAVVTKGSQVEVIGYKGALIVDLSATIAPVSLVPLEVRNVRLTYLDHGDRFDLASKAITPSPEKALRKLDRSKPYNKLARYYPDVLGNTAVVDLMQNFIDNPQEEVVGLAIGNPDDAQPELGFEFRFRKDKDSVALFTGLYGAEDYTVSNIYLDVRPIQLSLPLYTTKP